MFCKVCGATLKNGAAFCTLCGSPTSNPMAGMGAMGHTPASPVRYGAPAPAPAPTWGAPAMAMPVAVSTPTPNKGHGALTVLSVITAVLVAAVLGILLLNPDMLKLKDDTPRVGYGIDIGSISLSLVAPGLEEGSTRVPLQFKGINRRGRAIDQIVYVDRNTRVIEADKGKYDITVIESPISRGGGIYQVPSQTISMEVGDTNVTMPAINLTPIDASQVTTERINEVIRAAQADPASARLVDELEGVLRSTYPGRAVNITNTNTNSNTTNNTTKNTTNNTTNNTTTNVDNHAGDNSRGTVGGGGGNDGADGMSISVPGVTTPEIDVPSVSLPDVKVGDVEVEGVDLPEVKVPSVEVPGVDVKNVKLPSFGF